MIKKSLDTRKRGKEEKKLLSLKADTSASRTAQADSAKIQDEEKSETSSWDGLH
jgi:hypothetical protein